MIGRLSGQLIEKTPPFLMVDVGGVGYRLQAPLSTFLVLPECDNKISLRTHFIVREDAQLLFGFATEDECELFQEIIKITGIGPKVALAILSGLSTHEFREIVTTQETRRLQSLPGIGLKTAQRILLEMQNRVNKLAPYAKLASHSSKAFHEATTALIALGYKPQEAMKAVNKVDPNSQSCEKIIKEALQGMAKV